MPLDLEAVRNLCGIVAATKPISPNVVMDELARHCLALADECERLRANDGVMNDVLATAYEDAESDLEHSDKTVAELETECDALRARLAAIEKAAEPIADAASDYGPGVPDSRITSAGCTVGDLRRLARAVKGETP